MLLDAAVAGKQRKDVRLSGHGISSYIPVAQAQRIHGLPAVDDHLYRKDLVPSRAVRHRPGLERLVCAALADPNLALELLSNTTEALERVAEALQITPDERALAASIIGAADIYDFATQLYIKMRQADESR